MKSNQAHHLQIRFSSIALRHNFKDLHGGQSDTGDEQTLVIWTANGMDLSEEDHDLRQYPSLYHMNSSELKRNYCTITQ